MTRILFICHGNICRSPMAEAVMKHLVSTVGRDSEFEIASCATSTEEIGHPVYPAAQRELARHGIPCPARRAVRLSHADYAQYDLLVCMERYNLRNALSLLGGDPDGKLRLLLPERDVADPWYSDDFDTAFRDIEEPGFSAMLRTVS